MTVATQEWIQMLRLSDRTVDKAMPESQNPDPKSADIICTLIRPDSLSPLMGSALQHASKCGEEQLNELALAIFRAGVNMGINLTRIAMEDSTHE